MLEFLPIYYKERDNLFKMIIPYDYKKLGIFFQIHCSLPNLFWLIDCRPMAPFRDVYASPAFRYLLALMCLILMDYIYVSTTVSLLCIGRRDLHSFLLFLSCHSVTFICFILLVFHFVYFIQFVCLVNFIHSFTFVSFVLLHKWHLIPSKWPYLISFHFIFCFI